MLVIELEEYEPYEFICVSVEDMNAGGAGRYTYRQDSSRGSNYSPTAIITDIKKTLPIKIIGWFNSVSKQKMMFSKEEQGYLNCDAWAMASTQNFDWLRKKVVKEKVWRLQKMRQAFALLGEFYDILEHSLRQVKAFLERECIPYMVIGAYMVIGGILKMCGGSSIANGTVWIGIISTLLLKNSAIYLKSRKSGNVI